MPLEQRVENLLNVLIDNSNFNKVSIFVRTVPKISDKKLTIHKIDFTKLNEYKDLVKGIIFFSALGTTKKDAGGKKEQYLVDYTYQYEFAKMASENGVANYSLVSSMEPIQILHFFLS